MDWSGGTGWTFPIKIDWGFLRILFETKTGKKGMDHES